MKKKQADKIGERIGLAVLGFFIIFLALLAVEPFLKLY